MIAVRFMVFPVHPHVRGEHSPCLLPQSRLAGSSPRTGGTHDEIPRRHAAVAVHPHVRGEHSAINQQVNPGLGSSPRTGGTHCLCRLRTVFNRFIPTYGGNTYTWAKLPRAPPVHPHVRGEHSFSSYAVLSAPGSSPRTGGTLSSLCQEYRVARFIPTYGGNTVLLSR